MLLFHDYTRIQFGRLRKFYNKSRSNDLWLSDVGFVSNPIQIRRNIFENKNNRVVTYQSIMTKNMERLSYYMTVNKVPFLEAF